MSDLREKVILEKRIVDLIRGRGPGRTEANSCKPDEFRNRYEFLESSQPARGEMQFLHENGLVHHAVPVDARLHVALPFVEIDIVAPECQLVAAKGIPNEADLLGQH